MNSQKKRAIFIAGTDTGVGKTVLSCALLRRFRARGSLAAGIKPVETGCGYDEKKNLVGADGGALFELCDWLPRPVVSPYRFHPPVAPLVAARQLGMDLRVEDLAETVRGAFHYADLLIVEGAGGALSPVAEDGSFLDVAALLGAPVLLVAPDRLGVQSQLIAVSECLRARGLELLGFLLNRFEAGTEGLANRQMVEEFTKSDCLGIFEGPEHIDASISDALLDRLLEA